MKFYDAVLNVLKSDERFFSDNGELLRNAVYEAAMQMDANLIKALYNNEETKKRFFTDVDGIAVFDKVGFGWVINNREFLPDSYTPSAHLFRRSVPPERKTMVQVLLSATKQKVL